MPGVEEKLRRELERAADPADPSDAFERVFHKKVRRGMIRKAQRTGLALAVLAGTLGGVLALSRVFGPGTEDRTPGATAVRNGRIAFQVFNREETSFSLATVDADGSDFQRIPMLDQVVEVAWSPDGAHLAFSVIGALAEGGIYVSDPDGTGAHLVLPTDLSIWEIAWSPDGAQIAFVGSQIPEGGGTELDMIDRLYVVNADGSDLRPITREGQVIDAAWSPDGARFAITRQYAIGNDRLGSDLYVINADGSGEMRVTDDGASDEPTWSPDAMHIAFTSNLSGKLADREIFVMSVGGSDRTQLTDTIGTEEDPAWSPDGTQIVFHRVGPEESGRSCGLFAIGSDGSGERLILDETAAGGCPMNAAWQPVPAGTSSGRTPSSPGPATDPTAEPTPVLRGVGPVCELSVVEGDFWAGGGLENAYVYADMPASGDCTDVDISAMHLGIADDTGPTVVPADLECSPICRAFAAPDVDGDGHADVAVSTVQGASSIRVVFYRLASTDTLKVALVPIAVAPPGDPEYGYEPGDTAFELYGSVTHMAGVTCGNSDGTPLVVASMAARIGDGGEYRVHEVTFEVAESGFRQVSHVTYRVAESDPGFDQIGQGPDLCGAPMFGGSGD